MAKKKQRNLSLELFIALVMVGGLILAAVAVKITKPQVKPVARAQVVEQPARFDFNNHTITLDGQPLAGTFNTQALDPAGNRAAGILTSDTDGSGTFFYLVGGTLEDGKESCSQPILLGDRIKVESVSVDEPGDHDNGEITVEYLDRSPNAPMSEEPNIKVTRTFSFQDNGNLIEVLH